MSKIRDCTMMEVSNLNHGNTVHINIGVGEFYSEVEVPSLVNCNREVRMQVLHLLMSRVESDWPYYQPIGIIKSYQRMMCKICLGRVWRNQCFSPAEISTIMKRLTKQLGLSMDYCIVGTQQGCIDFQDDYKQVILEIHECSSLDGGLYTVKGKL